ncbi:MAG TPA: FAD-binding protein, partial [Nocardioides sp.]|nr:FAD-binding protein [Nocardioides sp.]
MEWRNWSGLESAHPDLVVRPGDVDAVVAAVDRARAEGTTVKMVGTGHSFNGIATPAHAMLRPDRLSGIIAVDRPAMTVTALAGTPLHVLNVELERLGLSLHNMGDIADQTLAGAISTGTHGTGGVAAGLSAQVAGLQLVTGTGELLTATAEGNADVLDLARIGLGALGVLTTITFRVEPLFVLEAHEQPMTWEQALASFDELAGTNHHVDLYWFPHTDRVLAKQNNRLDAGIDEAEPLSRARAWFDDELLANRAFALLCLGSNRVPGVIPRMNLVTSRLLTER